MGKERSGWTTRFATRGALDALREAMERGFDAAPAYRSRAEERIRETLGDPEAGVAMAASGTAALELVLRASGVGPGDRVAVPAVTFTATATAVRAVGAEPVLTDVTGTLLPVMAPDSLYRVSRDGGVDAVLVTHMDGLVADVDALRATLPESGIPVLGDACQALGARDRGTAAALTTDAAALSFNWTKIVGAGELGAVVTRDPEVLLRARRLRSWGHRDLADSWPRAAAEEGGWNAKPDLAALALLCYDLDGLPARLLRGRRALRAAAGAVESVRQETGAPVFCLLREEGRSPYTLRLRLAGLSVRARRAGRTPGMPLRRLWLAEAARRGAQADWSDVPPLHMHPAFEDCPRDRAGLPRAEAAWRESIRLRDHRLPVWEMTMERAESEGAKLALAAADLWESLGGGESDARGSVEDRGAEMNV